MSRSRTPTQTDAHHPETLFGLLSDGRRRDALAFLCDRNSTASLDEVAEAVGIDTAAADADAPSAAHPDRVAVALHHVHLPKLDDAGVVTYDSETKEVTPERTDAVEPLLATVADGR